jgi:hypothetical protein
LPWIPFTVTEYVDEFTGDTTIGPEMAVAPEVTARKSDGSTPVTDSLNVTWYVTDEADVSCEGGEDRVMD